MSVFIHEKKAYQTKIDGNFMIEYDDLRAIHAFCHSKMEKCLLTVLHTCNDRSQWVRRSDVFYKIECYHIDCVFWDDSIYNEWKSQTNYSKIGWKHCANVGSNIISELHSFATSFVVL